MARDLQTYKHLTSITKSSAKVMEEMMKIIATLAKECNNPFYDTALDRISKEVSKMAAREDGKKVIPLLSIDKNYFPYFIQLLQENKVDYVPFDTKDAATNTVAERKFVLYNPKDAEIVRMCRDKALLEKSKIHKIPYEQFMKYNYKEPVITIRDKDEIWLEKFNSYARAMNLNYTLKENEKGTFDVIAKEDEKEKLYKATFCTNWDFTGRFRNIERKKAEQSLERQRLYKERINLVPVKGGIYLINVNNTNERLYIHPQGFELYHKDSLVKDKAFTDHDYMLSREKLIGLMGKECLIIEADEYKAAKDKDELFKEALHKENRIYIRKEIVEEMQKEKQCREEILKHPHLKKYLNFDRAETEQMKVLILDAYKRMASPHMDTKTAEILQAIYAHLGETISICNHDEKSIDVKQVDLSMIDLKSIEEAKVYATIKELEKMQEEKDYKEEFEIEHEEFMEEPEMEEPEMEEPDLDDK